MPTVDQLATMIDHSVIDPFHTEQDLRDGVALARKYRTGQFVTQPFRVTQAKELLEGSGIALQTFVGFPHGSDHTEVKVLQAKRALDDGVDELDMVVNISSVLSGDFDRVEEDVRAVVDTASPYGVIVKAILDVYFLDDDTMLKAAAVAERAGVGFIKTSTGTRPDTTEDIAHKVALLRAATRPETTIKASGGVYSLAAVAAYYVAGARRFGAFETAAILDDYRAQLDAGNDPLETGTLIELASVAQ